MKERGILFSGPMVRALLAGRKTQTRRVVKPQPEGLELHGVYGNRAVFFKPGSETPATTPMCEDWICPYGAPGDRLWVRETWTNQAQLEGSPNLARKVIYKADGHEDIYRIDGEGHAMVDGHGRFKSPWIPSIHMPRAMSRITLEVRSIRVERLFHIGEAACRAEGMLRTENGWTTDEGQPVSETARRAYEDLWHSINGAWLDCWVWAIEFARVA